MTSFLFFSMTFAKKFQSYPEPNALDKFFFTMHILDVHALSRILRERGSSWADLMSPSPRSEQVRQERVSEREITRGDTRHDEEEHNDQEKDGRDERELTLLLAGLHGQSRFDVPPSLLRNLDPSTFRTTTQSLTTREGYVPCAMCVM